MTQGSVHETLSVREAIALPALEGAQVVGGEAGLERLIRTVNVMEVPDILEWVRPDELLLTTAYPLREQPESLGRLVRDLHERGLAGIFVKPVRYIPRIPQVMVDEADRLAFPVVALTAASSFNDIINAVLTILLNRQAQRLKRAQDIHDRFNEIVLTGGGFTRISQALSEAIGRPVAIMDKHGRVRAATGELHVADLPLVGMEDGDPVVREGTWKSNDLLVHPIRADGAQLGAIYTTAQPGELSDDGWEALQYAATVSALHQAQAQAFAAEDDRFRTIYLERLVSGEERDRAAAIERAAAFGWDLDVARVALVIADDAAAPPDTTDARRLRRLADATGSAAHGRALVWQRASEVAALLAVDGVGVAATRQAVSRLRAALRERLPNDELTIGFGRVAEEPEQLPQSFAEARRALTVGRWSGGSGGVHGFVDLGVERLLAGCDPDELAEYRNELIGPLLAYDAAHGTDLLLTLEQYLTTRNAAESARHLHMHHNTIRNRLARIVQVIGDFLDDGERCLSLALAVRIHRFEEARRAL